MQSVLRLKRCASAGVVTHAESGRKKSRLIYKEDREHDLEPSDPSVG